jgi:hypothetical protein
MAKMKVIGRRPKEVVEIYQRHWDGLDVVDADFNLLVRLQNVDLENSRAKDGFNCAFAQATMRMYGSQHVLFLRSVAYIDLDIKGERKLYRFNISDGAQRIIARVDTDSPERFDMSNCNFELLAPAPSHKLDEKRKKSRKYKKTRRRVLISGEATCATEDVKEKLKKQSEEKAAKKKKKFKYGGLLLSLSDVRNGAGLVRFSPAKVKKSVMKEAVV